MSSKARQTFGEEAGIGEFSLVIGPANLQKPLRVSRFNAQAGDIGRGDHDKRVEMGVQCPDLCKGNEEANFRGRSVRGLVFAPAHDGLSAEFTRFAIGAGLQFGWGKQYGHNEQKQTENGGDPAVPQTQRKNNDSRTTAGQGDAKQCPGFLVAVKLQQPGRAMNDQKERHAKEGLSAVEQIVIAGRSNRGGSRAHGAVRRLFYLTRVNSAGKFTNCELPRRSAPKEPQ